LYNRQLHENETDRIKTLAGGDPQKEADLSAAACALVHCSSEYAVGSKEYAYYSQLEATGNQPQFADDRALLQQQTYTHDVVIQGGTITPVTDSLFEYSIGDRASDATAWFNNSYGHPITRAGGALQAVGGLGATVTGGVLTAAGVAGCPESLGAGCAAAAGGVLLTGWGLDQTQAGGRTAWNGVGTQTFGGQAIQQAFGISPQAAELTYGLFGTAGASAASAALVARGATTLPVSGLGDAQTSPWLVDPRAGVRYLVEDFRQGGSFLVTQEGYEEFIAQTPLIGRADGQFLTTSRAMDDLLKAANGDVGVIKSKLGIPADQWNGPLIRIDVPSPLLYNARLPSGLEGGANSQFMWGGFTKGGMPEIVTNPIPSPGITVTKVPLNGK
jgi:hypothetical protein